VCKQGVHNLGGKKNGKKEVPGGNQTLHGETFEEEEPELHGKFRKLGMSGGLTGGNRGPLCG